MKQVLPPDEIDAFYFGVPGKELYGCHHLPQGSQIKRCSVVLCSPIGQEYIRSHRAMYQLAVRLSRVGFHVLRFDYFGCGDSSGDFEEGNLQGWTEDIGASIKEIQQRSGMTNVCLIGLRIGANLAMQAAVERLNIDSIVLWEPVYNGKYYLDELVESQRSYLAHLPQFARGWVFGRSRMRDEILGFPMTSRLREELEKIDLDHVEINSNIKQLILCNSEESLCNNGLNVIARSLHHAVFQVVDDPQFWVEDLYRRLIPFNSLNYVVKWLNRTQS